MLLRKNWSLFLCYFRKRESSWYLFPSIGTHDTPELSFIKKTHTHPTWNEYLTIILWKYMCLLVILLYFCHKQSCTSMLSLCWRLPATRSQTRPGTTKTQQCSGESVLYRGFFLFCVDKILFMENNIKQEFCRGWFMQTCIMLHTLRFV